MVVPALFRGLMGAFLTWRRPIADSLIAAGSASGAVVV